MYKFVSKCHNENEEKKMKNANCTTNEPRIKNVIFDFGQVLVKFDPRYMCEKILTNEKDVNTMQSVLFSRYYWDRLDAGTVSDEELMLDVKANLPEHLHDAAENIYYNWIYTLPEIDGMREVIALCRKKSYGVFLLSNISLYFATHKDEIPILSLFDGMVFSAECGSVKPTQEIFAYITDKFNLTPRETLFVDDSAINIDGANKFGINSYHFDGDAKKLFSFIESLPETK